MDRGVNQTSNEANARDGFTKDAAAFLRALACAAEGCRIHWADHPGVRALIADAQERLNTLFRAGAKFAAYISDGSWLCRDARLEDAGKAADDLALALHQRGFVALEITRQLGAQEMTGLAEALAQLRRGNATLDAEEIKRKTNGGVVLVALRTGSLRVVEQVGAGRATPAAGPGREWRVILEELFSGSVTGSAIAASAAQLSAQIDPRDTTTLRDLHARIGRWAGSASARDADPVMEKLRQFVRGLSASVRDALVATQGADPAGAIPFLSSVARDIPVEQLVSSVRRLGDDGPASRDAVLMFEGLARLAHSRGADVGAFVSTLEKWKDGAAGGEAGDEIERVLGELMTMRQYADFTPEDYRAQLEDATKSLGAPPTCCRLAPVDAKRTETQASAVAAMVCRDCDWHDMTRVLELVDRGMDSLIEENRFDLLCAVRGAAGRAVRAGAPSDIGERLERKLREPGVLAAALAQAGALDIGMDAREFAVRSGAAGILSLLTPGDANSEPVRRELLRTALVGSDAESMLDAIVASHTAGRVQLAALLQEISAVRGPGAGEVFRKAIRHASPELGVAIVESFPDDDDAIALAVFGDALRHPSASVGMAAIRRSFQDGPEKRHAELVRRYLSLELDPANMDDAIVRAAVATLLKCSSQGHAVAARVIETLARSWKLRGLGIAALIVTGLAAVETADERARRAVLRWRFSVGGVVGNTLLTFRGSGRRADAA